MKNIIIFLLNTFKNSQYINFIVFALIYFAIFIIIVLGYLFTSHKDFVSNLIVSITSHFFDINSDANITINIGSSVFLNYYLLVLFVLGIFQEITLRLIAIRFKKDFRAVTEKIKIKLFFISTITVLALEIIASILIKEWTISLVAICTFILLLILYFWYHFVVKIVNKIISLLANS